jgi:hypothetical protein
MVTGNVVPLLTPIGGPPDPALHEATTATAITIAAKTDANDLGKTTTVPTRIESPVRMDRLGPEIDRSQRSLGHPPVVAGSIG